MKIILGTTSPYRITAFKFLGLDFVTEGSEIDEAQAQRDNPEELVQELSKLKAKQLPKNTKTRLCLGWTRWDVLTEKFLKSPNHALKAWRD